MRESPAVRRARAVPMLLALASVFAVAALAAAAAKVPDPAVVRLLTDTPGEIVVRCEPPQSAEGAADAGWSRVTLVRVPDRGRVSFRSEPEGRASVSEPGILRDLRLVQVVFDVPPDDPRPVTVTLTIDDGRGPNEKSARRRPSSPAFESLYRHAVVNYTRAATGEPLGERGGREHGGRYLIITVPSFVTQVQPLAAWKRLKGVETKLVTLAETGSTAAQIKSYIQTAYDTWEVPPEYVLLVGDTEALPSYSSETWTDDYYGTLEGSDYFVDVMVGRISADTQAQCATQVAKIRCYERTPIQGNPNWPASALLTVADDGDPGDAVYYRNTWFIYDLLEPAGFAPIDTLFGRNDVTQAQVYQSWNAGRGFYNYRGLAWSTWLDPFDINPSLLTNSGKPTVVVSATCATGIFYEDGYICEAIVRAGSATNSIGGVAFFGSNTVIESSPALSRRRGAADMGFFEHAFGPDGGALGAACLAAKMAIYDVDQVRQEYEAWNLLGDPDMQLWTGPPSPIQVSHDHYYYAGQGDFVVTVLASGQPVEGALVACMKDTDIYEWRYSDAAGRAVFAFTPTSSGTLSVTVTALNHYPYEGSVSVLDSGPFLVCAELDLNDADGGNGDGLLSPGETADVSIRLSNVGDADAVNVTGTLRTPDPLAAVVDSVASYGTVPTGGSAWCAPPYSIMASADCGLGHHVPLALEATFGTTTFELSPPPIALATADLEFASVSVDDAAPGGDGAGTASSGETVGLVAFLENVGPVGASGLTAELVCLSPYATVTSGDAYLGFAGAGAGVSNSATPFVLAVSPAAPAGHVIELRLDLVGLGHSYPYEESIPFTVEVAGSTVSLPLGPEAYGYYAYDSGDTAYTQAPQFEWYDISPPGPGNLITEITNSDAAIATVNLLFGFPYYGEEYFTISVCSNGFISMGFEDYRLGNNSPIPSMDGPDRMIAPFWDDLNPAASGDVYKWLDAANHRFIIQFDEVPRWGTTETETFQVIFLNPDYYPTPTGDGEILFLYQTVSNPTQCTAGIENPDQTDGLGCVFDGTYDPRAAPLTDGLAVRFTTSEPVEQSLPWLTLHAFVPDDTAGNGNGLAEPGETVSLTLELTNAGEAAAAGVSGILTTEESIAEVIDGSGLFTDIPVGGTGSNAGDPFTIELSEAIDDTVVTLWAVVQANGGTYSAPVRCDLHVNLSATGIEEAPLTFDVLFSRPNPFTETMSLALALPEPAPVKLSVYSTAGRLVRCLDHGLLGAGRHLLRWDGRDERGHPVASGVYFLRVTAGERVEDRKAVLLR